jgi:hypothetical protein
MDDIDYLKANSQQHSYMFYVDSAKRNRQAYPSPNYYQVQFNNPLRNVYSIQVIDASIPRTHYNVDAHNNRLYYHTSDVEYFVDIDIGDYTNQQLLSMLNEKLNPNSIYVSFLSTPAEIRKQFLFKSKFPFTICTSKSSLRKTLGFDDGSYNTIESTNDPEHYDTFDVKNTLNSDTTSILINTNRVLWQRFVPSNTGRMNSVQFNVSTIEESVEMRVYVYNASIDTPIAISQTVSISPSTSIAIFEEWVSNNTELIEGQLYYIKIAPTGQHTFSVYVQPHTSVNDNLYIYENNLDAPFVPNTCSNYLASLYNVPGTGYNVARVYFGINTVASAINLLLQMSIYIRLESQMHSIVPPGIYNLIGDRYVLLRCKEIENHILSSIRSYDVYNPNTNAVEEQQYDTGIAKFKMGVIGYQEERFDFNTLPAYEFHPIGKLSTLTMLFENPEGRPYNFRGINHTITLVVNYYKPVISFKTRNEQPSQLYPDYNPNTMIYKTDDNIYNMEI